MKQIRVLHIAGDMNRGGVETFTMNVLRNINRQKFKFIYLCYSHAPFDYEDEIISLGGKIIRIPSIKEAGVFKHISDISRIIKNERIDIVHAHIYYNSIFSLIAAKKNNVKVRITHSHATRSEVNPSIVKRVYFFISKFIINTHSTSYAACGIDAGNSLFYKKNKFNVIYNGIILKDFIYDTSTQNQFRIGLGIPTNATVIGHVGRIDTQKNQKFVVNTFNEYLKINPNSYLILVGDGMLRAEINNLVCNLGIQENVIFLGNRADVNALYNTMNIFLFPSLREGLPITLIEAQANGLICLISNTIDKSVKLTDCINFYNLDNGAKLWARKIDELNLKRINTKETMENSPYNIAKSVKTVERLYEDSLDSRLQK